MGNYTFAQRYRRDLRFKEVADNLVLEAMFTSAGVDPEAVRRAYESGVSPLTLEALKDFVANEKAGQEPEEEEESEGVGGPFAEDPPTGFDGTFTIGVEDFTFNKAGPWYTVFASDGKEIGKVRGRDKAEAVALEYLSNSSE